MISQTDTLIWKQPLFCVVCFFWHCLLRNCIVKCCSLLTVSDWHIFLKLSSGSCWICKQSLLLSGICLFSRHLWNYHRSPFIISVLFVWVFFSFQDTTLGISLTSLMSICVLHALLSISLHCASLLYFSLFFFCLKCTVFYLFSGILAHVFHLQ